MEAEQVREPAFEAESQAYSLFQRGMRLLEVGHPGQAAMLLAAALRLEPGKNSIREGLARAEFGLGRYRQAVEHLEAILTSAPDHDYARYCLGRCLLALREREKARAQLRLACAFKPQSALYRKALDDAR